MEKPKVGLWLLGAHGGVATTVAVGVSALRQSLTQPVGLVSQLPKFATLDLADWDRIVVGGHDIRRTSAEAAARDLLVSNRVFSPQMLDAVATDLRDFESRIRPGILLGSGAAIEALATDGFHHAVATPRQCIDLVKKDLAEFVAANRLERAVVVNLASTEPSIDRATLPSKWNQLESDLLSDRVNLPTSSLYAIAAMESNMAYVNFTPSIGSDLAAIEDLAVSRQICHMGRDGKTGETLLKSVLAPMFAQRNLEIMSWVGHNIIGNLDGRILDDPANKQAKLVSKDSLLKQILEYEPQTLVTIEYIRSLGDWKTAWDHIHFRGFLGTPMAMQFTWQGCDSLLAAPLVLDLFRFAELASRFKIVGLMPWLACFFKSPMSVNEHNFHVQFQMLENWCGQFEGR